MSIEEIKALIQDLRLNHEYCPAEVILQAADELERLLLVATNDTTQERVAETSKNVHEPNYKALWQQMCDRCDELDKQLSQRQWVGLTPQERDEINEKVYGAVPHHVAFHHAIEARLKELNT